MKKSTLQFLFAFVFFTTGLVAQNTFNKNNAVERTKKFESGQISSAKSLVENLNSFSTYNLFVEALSQTELQNTIQGDGLYTVFVISNSGIESAFSNEKKLEAFLKSTNATQIDKLLRYHIIPGSVDKHSMIKEIEKRGGSVTYRTLAETMLTFKKEGDTIYITVDGGESRAVITDFDLFYNNGTFHVVDCFVKKPA